MADIGAALTNAILSNLISVRPMASNVADGAQAENTLRAQVGQLVQGTIYGMNNQGEPMLKSDQGNLALKLPFHLPSGVDVVLRMENASGGLRARVLLVDGMPLKDYAAQVIASGRPQQTGAPQDIISVHQPNLAQQLAKPTAPQMQSQLVNQQSSVLPGESNPALSTQAQRVAAGVQIPLQQTADAQLTRLVQIANDPVTVLLLSRNPQLSQTLGQIPSDIPLPPRITPGMQMQMQLVAIEKPIILRPALPQQPTAPSQGQLQPLPTDVNIAAVPRPPVDATTALGLTQMLGKLAAQQQAQARGATQLDAPLPPATTSTMSPPTAAPSAAPTAMPTTAPTILPTAVNTPQLTQAEMAGTLLAATSPKNEQASATQSASLLPQPSATMATTAPATAPQMPQTGATALPNVQPAPTLPQNMPTQTIAATNPTAAQPLPVNAATAQSVNAPASVNPTPTAPAAPAGQQPVLPTQTAPVPPTAMPAPTHAVHTPSAASLVAEATAQLPIFTTPPMGVPANAQGVFGGQVIDIETSGDALIQTVFGIVRMAPQPGISLQEGDRVQWQLQGFLPQQAVTPQVQRPTDALSQLLGLATRWDALEDTLHWLDATQQHASPAAMGMHALLSHLPKPDTKMGAAVMFLLNALRRNDSHSWIGKDTVQMLQQKGRADLLGRLEADFSALRQPVVDSPLPGWQALFFPVWADGQLQQARFFLHQNPDEGENGQKQDGKSANDIRFVLELTLSALGDMQLCGLVRKSAPAQAEAREAAQPTHFDLAIRSLRPLSPQHQASIREIFTQGAEITGYQGQILFQHTPSFPETPMESFARAMPGWTV
jgi:hypothetical protein